MFYSVMYPGAEKGALNSAAPSCAVDINLDQIFSAQYAREKGGDAERFYYTPLRSVDEVYYRQAVLRDLEDVSLRKIFKTLSLQLNGIERDMRPIMSQINLLSPDKWREGYIASGMLINCIDIYCGVVIKLRDALAAQDFKSDGLRGFTEHLTGYVSSEGFTEMRSQIVGLREKLKTVKYNMYVKEYSIAVRKYNGEERYSENLLALLEKFRQKEVSDSYLRVISQDYLSDKVEAGVFKLVMQEYEDVFGAIDEFCGKYQNFMDEIVVRTAREIAFYIDWLGFIEPLKEAGLSFCYPKIHSEPGDIYARNSFDLALADSLRGEGVVTNDFELKAPEQIIVITGPNQGGKTTFARMFGQAHYLAALGLSVPGSEAQLFLCDKVLTHFGKQEDLERLSGQLQDDLLRLKSVLEEATSSSVVVINEIFTSTTLQDALDLGGRMMEKLKKLRAPSLVITFFDELANHGPETISMVSSVREDDPIARTYKILRKKPDGLAFAIHLARKNNMTYEQIIARIKV